jgi:hypothetical protein
MLAAARRIITRGLTTDNRPRGWLSTTRTNARAQNANGGLSGDPNARALG